jgi:hypothetical protein
VNKRSWIIFFVLVLLLGFGAGVVVNGGAGDDDDAGELQGRDDGDADGDGDGDGEGGPEITETVEYQPGDCVAWNDEEERTEGVIVACEDDHQLEMVAPVELDRDADAAYPNEAEWDAIVADVCVAAVEAYPGAPLENGESVSGLRPTESEWDLGDRTVWCAIEPG